MAQTRKLSIASLAAATLLLGLSTAVDAADRSETVKFKQGATSATLSGSLKGYDGVDYKIGAAAGQTMSVTFKPSNLSCYFNVLPPGSNDVAIYTGDTSGNAFTGKLDASGDYKVRVYLMRNAARRNETCNYDLSIAISAAAAPAQPAATNDAVVPGTDFNATAEAPCSRGDGRPTTNCKVGVKRSGNDNADVTVFWPDSGTRVLFFENGAFSGADISQADGSVETSTERQNDLTVVRVGKERFEIPDVLVLGD